MKKNIEQTYKILSDIDHTLLRPSSFLGSVTVEKCNKYILDKNKFVIKEVCYNPGFHKLFDEIISNSVDESKRPNTKLTTIKVDIDKKKGEITVYDNGGIPVEMHKETKLYVPNMIFGYLRSSSNYNDDEDRNWVGVNGIGSKITNIFSTKFNVITADGKNKFSMTWTNNMKRHTAPIVEKTKLHFTKITYIPELSRFNMDIISDDDIKLMEKRVYEIAGCNPNLNIYFQEKKISIKSFQDYCKMYIDNNVFIYEENKNWQIGVSFSLTSSLQQVSYVNSVYTYDGGSHCDYILNQISSFLREKINKKNKFDLLPGQIKNHLFLFVNSTIIRPSFSSQTKEKLITNQKDFGTEIKLSDKFLNSVYKSEITKQILDWVSKKNEAEERAAVRTANKAINKIKIGKLVDAKGRDRRRCSLMLCEGDSPMAGFRKYRNPETQGGFPLRGKSLNVRELSESKAIQNQEIQNIMAALGLQFGKSPFVYDKNGKLVQDNLRYGEIHIYSDADVDGTSCASLLVNVFEKWWPELFKEHRVARCETPVIIATNKKTKKTECFYYDDEWQEWQRDKDLDKWDVDYKKGLSALTDEEYEDIIKNPRLYYYDITDNSRSKLVTWFGSDSAARKEVLSQPTTPKREYFEKGKVVARKRKTETANQKRSESLF